MPRSDLDAMVAMLDKHIDRELESIKVYQKEQRETNDQYADRGDWDNLILNTLEHIIARQKDRRQLIKDHI